MFAVINFYSSVFPYILLRELCRVLSSSDVEPELTVFINDCLSSMLIVCFVCYLALNQSSDCYLRKTNERTRFTSLNTTNKKNYMHFNIWRRTCTKKRSTMCVVYAVDRTEKKEKVWRVDSSYTIMFEKRQYRPCLRSWFDLHQLTSK